uniref:Uncharacterized protein n=1 Tax=viral metagenome TaxID=1070528 RepID=A0A6C0H5U2_9ZZZZ
MNKYVIYYVIKVDKKLDEYSDIYRICSKIRHKIKMMNENEINMNFDIDIDNEWKEKLETDENIFIYMAYMNNMSEKHLEDIINKKENDCELFEKIRKIMENRKYYEEIKKEFEKNIKLTKEYENILKETKKELNKNIISEEIKIHPVTYR